MPIDLVAALVGWLVSSAGDAGIRLVRGPAGERALRKATRRAITAVVSQVDSEWQEPLREGLYQCFSSPLRIRLEPSIGVGPWLRAAITEQVALLDHVVFEETKQSLYAAAAIDPDWLKSEIVDSIITSLREMAAEDELSALVHSIDTSDVIGRLDYISQQVEQVAPTPSAAATRILPRDISYFTGRASEFSYLLRHVEHSSFSGSVIGISALDGMAGIGKTALAVHVAHQLAPRFPDGQIFLELHAHTPGKLAVDPGDALTSLLLTIGVGAKQIPQDTDSRSRLWRHHLADKKIILVLDDAAGYEQVRLLLPGSPTCLVLITSRHRMTSLEDAKTITLDPLPPQEAAELLVRVAGRGDIDASTSSSREIVRLCGYLPLAIRIMARQLGNHSSWATEDVATELATAHDRLSLLQAENTSVSAAFNLSYQDLTVDEQRMFQLLGLHPGTDIDAYAAAALAELDLSSTRHLLNKLYDRNIITEPSRQRYRFHDLVRHYAQNLATKENSHERKAAIGRLLDYYLHVTTLANHHLTRRSSPIFRKAGRSPVWLPDLSTPVKAADWMTAERQNLNAVVEYAFAQSQLRHTVEIPAVMNGFLCTQGYWAQAMTLHHQALAAARELDDVHGQAVALNQIGHIQRLTSDYRSAIATQEEAKTLAAAQGDDHSQANALDSLGVVQYLMGDYSASVENLNNALALFRGLDDLLGQAEVLLHLGAGQQATGDYPAASATLSQALELYHRLGHLLGEAEALNYLGVVQYHTGKYQESLSTLGKAAGFQRTLGDSLGEAEVLNNLGAVFCEVGDYGQCVDNLKAALEFYEDLGNRRGQATVLNNLSVLLFDLGNFKESKAILTNALQLHRELGNRRGEGNALRLFGAILNRMEEHDAAFANLNEALQIFRSIGDRRGEAETINALGDALSSSSDSADRRTLHEEALLIAREISVPAEEAHALESISHICFAQGNSHDGVECLAQALSIRRHIGLRRTNNLR